MLKEVCGLILDSGSDKNKLEKRKRNLRILGMASSESTGGTLVQRWLGKFVNPKFKGEMNCECQRAVALLVRAFNGRRPLLGRLKSSLLC